MILTSVAPWDYFRLSTVIGSLKLRTGEPMDKDLLEFLQAFREETTKRFDEMGQEVGREIRQEVGSLREETIRRFDEMGQEVHELRQEVHAQREDNAQRFEKLETEVRGAHIIVEDLRDKVQIVAEGVAGFTEQLQKHKDEVSKRLDTIESFTRLCYQDLDGRVRRLEAI